MSNGKDHQQPQCLREMRQETAVETGENLHWGQLLWAGLGVHPYVWQMWVRIWLGLLWLTGSPCWQLHQRGQWLRSSSLWPEAWGHRPSLSCPQRQHYPLLKIVPYFAHSAEYSESEARDKRLFQLHQVEETVVAPTPLAAGAAEDRGTATEIRRALTTGFWHEKWLSKIRNSLVYRLVFSSLLILD